MNTTYTYHNINPDYKKRSHEALAKYPAYIFTNKLSRECDKNVEPIQLQALLIPERPLKRWKKLS